jgi:ATP-binding protein involved in chromosome partitioning
MRCKKTRHLLRLSEVNGTIYRVDMSTTIKQVLNELENFIEPASQVTLKKLNAIRSCELHGEQVHLVLDFGFPIKDYGDVLVALLQACVAECGVELKVTLQQSIVEHRRAQGIPAVPNVKNIIAVSSAKGGVGKSTVALHLALALQYQGAKVGLLDADIYGPSLPHMLGCSDQPKTENKKLHPVEAHGLQTMSIGYLTAADAPVVWRGPMVTRALQQLLTDTLWRDLDYLIIDMPPGTGDIQLTLAQKIPVSGAVILTTPQAVACLDAVKGLQMFSKVNVPVLGIVENMSHYECAHCGTTTAIFDQGGAAKIAADYGIRLLGEIPFDTAIRASADSSTTPMSVYPHFATLARNCAAQLSLQAKDYQRKFPDIIIENK